MSEEKEILFVAIRIGDVDMVKQLLRLDPSLKHYRSWYTGTHVQEYARRYGTETIKKLFE